MNAEERHTILSDEMLQGQEEEEVSDLLTTVTSSGCLEKCGKPGAQQERVWARPWYLSQWWGSSERTCLLGEGRKMMVHLPHF